VSKHLTILKQARLVESRKEGRWMYYRLAGNEAGEQVREAIAWVLKSLKKDEVAKGDAVRMKVILRQDPEELCRRQMGRACCEPEMNGKRVRIRVRGRS
jgi:ArsR family transcriptional regulator